jgi:two-component system, NtrC family, sensor kinase
MRGSIYLALRYKIMITVLFFLAASLFFVGVVYHRHQNIQNKLKFIEHADDLHNSILEARRYEKNLFLYGGKENFREVLHYLDLAEEQLTRFQTETATEISASEIEQGKRILSDYRTAVEKYEDIYSNGKPGPVHSDVQSTDQELRDFGHTLTGMIKRMVTTERKRVDELVQGQKRSLFYSVTVFIVIIIVVVYSVFNLIFKPLSSIQQAAAEITRGNVRQIPPVRGLPEIQSLISALNVMILELDKKSEQLVQQEKMAALGTLTSGVAHELNNPLSNISSSTQILFEELGESDLDFQRNLLIGVEQQVEKARDIVRSLLEFAREREFEPHPTDMKTLVENTVKLVRGKVPKDVDIRIDIPYPLVVEVDQRRMSQALMNLILNGLQAMNETGGQLKIGVYYDPGRNGVSLEVSDSGMGISLEHQAKIFDPFFSTKDVGDGTGLGLYVTYGIIQKHHGHINVTSRPGEGTRFSITLPARQPEEDHG